MPELNAALNFTSAIFLIVGFIFIRRGVLQGHKICMLSACVSSTIFLVSYIYYHLHHGATRFPGVGGIRSVYFTILISHTILAVVQIPLIFMTLRAAFTANFERHKKLAKITWPMWLYVSVTGVVIYWMLYQVQYS